MEPIELLQEEKKKPFPWVQGIAYIIIIAAISSITYLGYQIGSFNEKIVDQTATTNVRVEGLVNDLGRVFTYLNSNVVPLVNSMASSTHK